MDQQDTGINRYSRNKQNKNRVWSLVSRGDKTFEVPQKKVLNGHDFYLIFTGDTKNKAKKIATKQHKIGFHTRVIEIYPTVWAVYRRNIIPYLNA